MNNEVSKQEYLKRYLEDNKPEKKRTKKIKKSSTVPSIKIIDQDISIKSIKFGTEEEKEEDEAPVVAEIIDDRPIEVKTKEIYEASKWKTLGGELQAERPTKVSKISSKLLKRIESSDKNLPSVPATRKRHDSDDDLSPPRVSRKRHDSDDDLSPPRRVSRNRHDSDDDLSPPRASRQTHNSRDDLSPPRSNTHKNSNKSVTKNRRRNDSDSDISPERLGRRKSVSPKADSDLSPERPNVRRSPASKNEDSDLSPPRVTSRSSKENVSISKDKSRKPEKTLLGLKAGLQNLTTSRRKETEEMRQREMKHINELDSELSGRHAKTIVRDRQTGRKRDIEGEQKIDEEKDKRKEEQMQKYSEWGKGVEQTKNRNLKVLEDMYETTKPLARYCDDEDLEQRLKAEIHDEDPMANYMRKKQQKKATSVYPVYQGPPPPPNRFGIPPGYRWDGVDRSNGFEKKYFEKRSNRKAAEEDAYMWSIQDM